MPSLPFILFAFLLILGAVWPFVTWTICRRALGELPDSPWYERARWLQASRTAHSSTSALLLAAFILLLWLQALIPSGHRDPLGLRSGVEIFLALLAVHYVPYPGYFLLWRSAAPEPDRSFSSWCERLLISEPRFLFLAAMLGAQVPLAGRLDDLWWVGSLLTVAIALLLAITGVLFTASWRAAGLIGAAPSDAVTRFAAEAAAQGVPKARLWLLTVRLPLAFALPWRGVVLYSAGLAKLLSEEELAAIFAHEIAHLTESRWMRFCRLLPLALSISMLFAIVLLLRYGPANPFALIGLEVVLILAVLRTNSWFASRVAVDLEKRADESAVRSREDPAVYATALAKLYEATLVPAVSGKAQRTHPDLYDRMISANVTPPFARPAPPSHRPSRISTSVLAGTLFFSLMLLSLWAGFHQTLYTPPPELEEFDDD